MLKDLFMECFKDGVEETAQPDENEQPAPLPKASFYQNSQSAVVNYVWINKENFIPGNHAGDPQCGIPLHYIDKTIENAKRYPEANFQIWLDPRYLSESPSEFLLQSYLLFSDCTNIKIRTLCDIEDYVQSPMFEPPSRHSIWVRVDLARLLVTQQTLKEHPDKTAIYADFDVGDVLLHDDKFKKSINNVGFALGSTAAHCKNIENGYFAFQQKGAPLLNSIIERAGSPTTRSNRNSIYASFVAATKLHCREQHLAIENYTIHALNLCEYTLPKNPAHQGVSSIRP